VCRFLGSSGQSVKDVIQYTNRNDYLDILEQLLLGGHLAPTAPDTLGPYSVPYI
jgi:DNA polymerase delta subunit 2